MKDGFISREEFTGFEENVGRRFDDVFRILTGLSSKLDTIASKGTNWSGLGVALTGAVAIATLFGWGMNIRFSSNERTLDAHAVYINEHSRMSAELLSGNEAREHERWDRTLDEFARTREMNANVDARISKLEAFVSEYARVVDDVQAEQARRTNSVYNRKEQ